MQRHFVLSGILSVCVLLCKSQAKTLAALVCAAVPTHWATLVNIGRAMNGNTRCPHKIKSVGRFMANPRVSVADARAGVIVRRVRRKDVPWVVTRD
jgi:hypothetical protein